MNSKERIMVTPTLTVTNDANTVILSNGFNPTGMITFVFFDSDVDDYQSVIFSEDVDVTGNGQYTAQYQSINHSGPYTWIAVYSGDVNNQDVMTTYNDVTEL